VNAPVVIVGGGVGGLAAGVALAQEGVDVCLFEQRPRVGGYAVAWQRDAHLFDLALHVVPAGGPGQAFSNLVTDLGLGEDVAFVRLREGFRVLLGDYSFEMPNDYEALFSRLHDEFPAERPGLVAFRKDLERYVRVYARLFDSSISKWRSLPPFLPRIPTFLKHTVLPVERYLARFFQDPRLKAILIQPAIFMGIPMSEFPTITFMMMFYILLSQGMYTVRGGGQALTDALHRRLGELGATVVTGMKVETVIIREKRAVGVRTQDGTEHPASAVVSGVSTPCLVNEIVGRSHFPSRYLAVLEETRPSLSAFVMNLGLDCPPCEIGILNYITVSFPDANIDGWLRSQRESRLLHGFSITAYANADPNSGRSQVVSIVGGSCAQAWFELDQADYPRVKKQVAQDLLAEVERLYPGISEHVETTDVATPRSLHRLTGNPSGAILGFDSACGMHRRIMSVSRLPIAGLYSAGAWTDRLGGFMQSMEAGARASKKLLKDLKG